MRGPCRSDLAVVTVALLVLALPSNSEAHADDHGVATVELVADGFDSPSNVASPRDGRRRIYVIDQTVAAIRTIEGGRLVPETFLDLSDRLIQTPDVEDGLLSLAFSPQFPQTPYVYVTYIDVDGDLVLSRFEVTASGLEALRASEQIFLKLPRYAPMHHCGHIEFGPEDGLLYLCVGDMQGNQQVQPIAQDPNEPRGKILRLDVEPRLLAGVQRIAAVAASDDYEIWLSGLRNPWRFGFDRATGDLYIPDVGRRAWEEINVVAAPVEAGRNFGWPLAEGNECVGDCDRDDLTWPIYEYPHIDDRCAVIGGTVYRGSEFPDWQGVYVFSDQCSGEIWALRDAAGTPMLRKLAKTDLMPSALGTQFDGEILIADQRTGAVWKLMLPKAEADWHPARDIMFVEVTEARRSKVGWTIEEMRGLQTSRIWKLVDMLWPLRQAWRRVERWF